MLNKISLFAVCLATGIGLITGSVAADPWKDESGHGRKGKHGEYKKHEYKEEYRRGKRGYKREWKDGDCKYEYKSDKHGYKEEYKCRRGASYSGGPPPWAPAHGYRGKKRHGGHKEKWRKEQKAAVYQLPPGLRNGQCRPDMFDTRVVGGVIGAATGGYVGSKFGKGDGKLAATAVGTLVGAVIGHAVGEQLAHAENTCFSQTFEHAPDRETIVWRDSRRDAEYRVTPVRTTKTASGEYCREYTAKATVGGKPITRHGTACRQPDGSWKLIN
jgi:surface antigen